MSQKPLKDMSYKGYDKMSEESGYVYSEWIKSVVPLYKMIEEKLGKKEIDILIKMLDGKASQADFIDVQSTQQKMLDGKVDKKEFLDHRIVLESRLSQIEKNDTTSVCALSTKVDSLKEAVQALTDKLDAEDVANLDTDYRATVDALIK